MVGIYLLRVFYEGKNGMLDALVVIGNQCLGQF